jgi:hypothetical protein
MSDNVVSDLVAGFINNGIIVEEATDTSMIQENSGAIYNLNGGPFSSIPELEIFIQAYLHPFTGLPAWILTGLIVVIGTRDFLH